MEVVVDVADQAGLARHQEEGTEAAGTEALNPISQFVMDVRGYPTMFPCNSRYLNGTGFFDPSCFNNLSIR
jgi:pyrimidine deaminase RibD-like protein